MENVIFIPGITGTTLVNSNSIDFNTIYSGIQSYFEKVDQIKLQINAEDDEEDTMVVERSHIEAIAYREIVNLFPPEDYRVFIFGYDWRKSNLTTAAKLRAFIQMLRRKLGSTNERFHFVTHSMGGLVFSAYLKLCSGDYSAINRVVITVPPFLGAVEALKGLVMGKWTFVDSKSTFRKVAITLPGMYELLPDYEIPSKRDQHPPFVAGVIMNGQPADIWDPNNWQTSIYRDEKDQNIKDMIKTRLEAAKSFRQNNMMDFTQLPQALLDRMLILTGEGANTMTGVMIEPTDANKTVENYFDFANALIVKDSDGTVPSISCRYYKDVVLTLSVQSRLVDLLGQHANFLNYDRVQLLIQRFLKLHTQTPEEQIANKLPGSKWWMMPDGTVKLL